MREEQLRYVLEIAHTGSINKAADSLFISHQSLERSLKNFETELGVQIFVRTQKGVEVTELGKVALEKIQELVFGFDELRNIGQINAKQGTDFVRSFTIYTAAYIRYPLINLALQRLICALPNIKFFGKTCRTIDNIQDDEFYLLISADKAELQTIDLAQYFCQEFFEDKMYLVVSVNHPLAKYKEVSIRTALHYAFVILQMEDSLPNPLQYWCLGKNIEMSIGLETDHLPTYINAIRGGKVIGCWPEIALTMPELRSCKDLKVLSVKDLPRFCVYGLMTQESYEKNKDVMEILLQVIRQKSE